jgi:hypothetical protein
VLPYVVGTPGWVADREGSDCDVAGNQCGTDAPHTRVGLDAWKMFLADLVRPYGPNAYAGPLKKVKLQVNLIRKRRLYRLHRRLVRPGRRSACARSDRGTVASNGACDDVDDAWT